MDFIKIKKMFVLHRIPARKWKGKPQNVRKYLQITYVRRNIYP